MMRRTPLIAATGLAAVLAISLGMTSAFGTAAPRSLRQAMSAPHGPTVGEPRYAAGSQGVDPDAAGVNDGVTRQAAGVRLHNAPAVTADQLLSDGDRRGACTLGYGRGRQCLPTTPPSAGQMAMSVQQMPWACTEVVTLFPTGVLLDVPGVDPAHLDRNGDGIGCGAGDS